MSRQQREPFVVLCALLVIFAHPLMSEAAVKTENVEYRHNDAVLEGFLAYDDAGDGKRPGILIVHEWTGINDYIRGRARQLAELGFVAFAADIYGKGVRPAHRDEAAAQAAKYRANRPLLRARAAAGLAQLQGHALVDAARIAAIGYCFGGGTVLELARSGARIAGVVSFHGNLDTPDRQDASKIKARVLVLHGADDPHVSREQVAAFQDEMRSAGVDWQMVSYGNAVHSFTNPDAGTDPSTGSAYNRDADDRSWIAMRAFFNELFR